MGILWTQPIKVKTKKGDYTLIISAEFPTGKFESQRIWNLWKLYKPQLKKDGFSISKYKGKFKISWFYKITPDTYKKVKGVFTYAKKFDEVHRKWAKCMAGVKGNDKEQSDDELEEKEPEGNNSDNEQVDASEDSIEIDLELEKEIEKMEKKLKIEDDEEIDIPNDDEEIDIPNDEKNDD
jgi:hypothetical protein